MQPSFYSEILIILAVAVASGTVVGLTVWGYCRIKGALLSRAIEKALPRNGNGPPLSALLAQSPHDTGSFRKLEENA